MFISLLVRPKRSGGERLNLNILYHSQAELTFSANELTWSTALCLKYISVLVASALEMENLKLDRRFRSDIGQQTTAMGSSKSFTNFQTAVISTRSPVWLPPLPAPLSSGPCKQSFQNGGSTCRGAVRIVGDPKRCRFGRN